MAERKLNLSLFSIIILLLCAFHDSPGRFVVSDKSPLSISVGVVLDLEASVGRMSRPIISLALEDFYASHVDYRTRLQLHFRDSKEDIVVAASEGNREEVEKMVLHQKIHPVSRGISFSLQPTALDLLKNEHVLAIIGPSTSSQADFLVNLGNKTRVPIVSFSATSPSISPAQVPYFVRTTLDDSLQVKCIASVIKLYGWRDVVPIYEDTRYGAGMIPYLVDSIQEIDGRIPYRSVMQLFASDNQIKQELYKLKTMSTRVFVVHMSAVLGARFFLLASKLGMVHDDYVWILTDMITDVIDSMGFSVLESMQGFIAVRPHIRKSIIYTNFTRRWRKKYRQMNSKEKLLYPNIYICRAYDTVWALAMAAETLDLEKLGFRRFVMGSNTTDLGILEASQLGPDFLRSITEVKFEGLAGNFVLVNGGINSSVFQIINVNGTTVREVGYWTEGKTSRLLGHSPVMHPGELDIIWPGRRNSAPKGWVIPTSGKKLKIGVPKTKGFEEFVGVKSNSITNQTEITGFCIDVFDTVMKNMPYNVPYEYIPFEQANGSSRGYYDDLVNAVAEQRFDAVVGDTTILADRAKSVDFTLPFTESGWTMIVKLRKEDDNGWIFIMPWKKDLWVTSFLFFLLTGFVIWMIEHRKNPDFRGLPRQHLGKSFYFTFSTMVFSHRENVVSNFSRIVIIVWIFVVMILQSSFTANLASLLTLKKLDPTFTDIHDVLATGQLVGYTNGSFVGDHLKRMGFPDNRIMAYNNPDEFAKALTAGTANGGVAAIFDEIPYINVFLSKYCSDYTMTGPVYKADGFGFVFPKGSPLVRDVSWSILSTTEGPEMTKIQKAWFDTKAICSSDASKFGSTRLSLKSFAGLFYITGSVSVASLVIFLARFFFDNRKMVQSEEMESSVWRKATSKAVAWAKHFDKKDVAISRRMTQCSGDVSSGEESGGGHLEQGSSSNSKGPSFRTTDPNEDMDSSSYTDMESPRTPGTPQFQLIGHSQAR